MVRPIVFLVILSLPAWSAGGPTLEASVPAIINSQMPAFYNGYLYSRFPENSVTLFAPDGHSIFTLPKIQGAGHGYVHVQSVARDSDGTLAVAWVDRPNAGIDIRDSAGKLIRSIDTGKYLPAHLSFSEHSLWALGWEWDANREFGYAAKDYAAVRKYSLEGKQIGAYLPRSSFPTGMQPGGEGWQERRITINSDRVGIEAISGNDSTQREWIEFDLNGEHSSRWRLNPSDEFPGVAFTSDNQAYVHRFDREKKLWRVFKLNREKSTWEEVSAPNLELYGADGDKLVFARSSYGVIHLSWYPQP